MKEVTTAAGYDRQPDTAPVPGPEIDPTLRSLADAMAMLDRLDSDLARYERELGGVTPPGP